MTSRIPVAILGATGTVGQRLVLRLADHPWFEITRLFASEARDGQPYKRAARWLQPTDMPKAVRNLAVEAATPEAMAALASPEKGGCPLVFSALGTDAALELEPAAAQGGATVFSNASAFRMHPDVPLVVPEVNAEHLALAISQATPGAILTNPNCTSTGLVLALAPLWKRFGLRRVHVVSLQALSGAGLVNGQPLSIGDDVVPDIPGESEKLHTEPQKILGAVTGDEELSIEPASLRISARTTRVPVSHGHTLCVTVELGQAAAAEELCEAWSTFRGRPQELELPSAPSAPVHVVEGTPRPLAHRDLEHGMAAAVGGLERDPIFEAEEHPEGAAPGRGWSFVTLSHNLERGAAGGAVLNAELWCATQPGLRERLPS